MLAARKDDSAPAQREGPSTSMSPLVDTHPPLNSIPEEQLPDKPSPLSPAPSEPVAGSSQEPVSEENASSPMHVSEEVTANDPEPDDEAAVLLGGDDVSDDEDVEAADLGDTIGSDGEDWAREEEDDEETLEEELHAAQTEGGVLVCNSQCS